jgi:hypothetical protein
MEKKMSQTVQQFNDLNDNIEASEKKIISMNNISEEKTDKDSFKKNSPSQYRENLIYPGELRVLTYKGLHFICADSYIDKTNLLFYIKRLLNKNYFPIIITWNICICGRPGVHFECEHCNYADSVAEILYTQITSAFKYRIKNSNDNLKNINRDKSFGCSNGMRSNGKMDNLIIIIAPNGVHCETMNKIARDYIKIYENYKNA